MPDHAELTFRAEVRDSRIFWIAAALCLLPAGVALAQTTQTYVVQVSAQRTETELRLAYQSLQLRFPAVLGDRAIIIRRVELAGGVWYRGQIGPFGTKGEADVLCDGLMAAGGECIVVPATQPSTAMPPSAPAAAPSEPKRVKTLAIRPDASAGNSPQQPPAPVVVAPVAPAASEPKRVKTTVIRPDGSEAGAPQSSTPSRGGNYAVQVASQRTEAEARSAYQTLQQKYPSVLGGREPIMRRADLGERGTYHRAQVGPFGTAQEAAAFCESLKALDGQCIVVRN
jgi:hypothetical protein